MPTPTSARRCELRHLLTCSLPHRFLQQMCFGTIDQQLVELVEWLNNVVAQSLPKACCPTCSQCRFHLTWGSLLGAVRLQKHLGYVHHLCMHFSATNRPQNSLFGAG
eukprot:COSAG05_NODE_1832_length_3998_cov_11.418312_4_plen_107_part_00